MKYIKSETSHIFELDLMSFDLKVKNGTILIKITVSKDRNIYSWYSSSEDKWKEFMLERSIVNTQHEHIPKLKYLIDNFEKILREQKLERILNE